MLIFKCCQHSLLSRMIIIAFLIFLAQLGYCMETDMVKLRNKTRVPKSVLSKIMESITSLMHEEPAVFYEFVGKCEHEGNILGRDSWEILTSYDLLNSASDSIPDPVRNVVLSSIEEEGMFGLRIVDPQEK